MAKSRARKYVWASLRHSRFSNVKQLYWVKNVRYGKYCDTTDYSKIQVSFKNERATFEKSKDGEKATRSLWRAREKIYHLVEANRKRTPKPVFFTLTRADQEKDIRESNRSIKALMRRLKAELGYSPKYIIVPERHKTGAIHYHGVFFNLPFISVQRFRRDLWKLGYVDLQVPRKIKSVARYLAKYLTKATLTTIPKNEKTYFTSRGLIRPQITLDTNHPEGIMGVLEIRAVKNGVKYKYVCKE